MKILMLSSRYEPYGQGGAERAARTLAARLRQVGHDVVVLTISGTGETGDRIVDDVRVRAVPLWNVYDLGTSQPAALKSVWHLTDAYNPVMQAAVARVIAEERPDVVHTQLLTGFSASAWRPATSAGIPVVHTLHDHYILCSRSTMSRNGVPCGGRHLECAILAHPRMIASRSVTWVVGVSAYIIDRHRRFHAFEGVHSSVIPNPCHLVGAAAGERMPSGQLRFGFMGRLERAKGIELLVQAMESVPETATLVVAGVGEPEFVDRVRGMAEGRQITFVGTVDPASFLREIDVMVVPSVGLESFGLSAAEALAMGVPVIVSSRGALPELVKPERTGWVFDPGDQDGLSRAMRAVVANRDRIAGMAAECRQSVQHCDPSAVASAYVDLYESLIARTATPD